MTTPATARVHSPVTNQPPTVGDATASTLRRMLIGIALVAQPIAGLAEHALDPKAGPDRAAQLAAIAATPDQRLLGTLVGLLALVLFVPVVLGLVHLSRARAPLLSLVGGALALAGALGSAALHGVELVELEMIRAGVDLGQVAAVTGQVEESAGGLVTLLLFLVGMLVGTLVLAVALWRARTVPRLAVLLIAAFLLLDAAGAIAEHKPTNLLAHTLLLIGSGWIGLRVLGMSNEHWERVARRNGTMETTSPSGSPAAADEESRTKRGLTT